MNCLCILQLESCTFANKKRNFGDKRYCKHKILSKFSFVVKLMCTRYKVRSSKNTIFEIMGKFHDFGKIQFRSTPPKLSLNWETGNLPK